MTEEELKCECPDCGAPKINCECVADCAPGPVATSGSPAAESQTSPPVERRHSPVGVVLDELLDEIDARMSVLKEWMDDAAVLDDYETAYERRWELGNFRKLVEQKRAKHGPSERSERSGQWRRSTITD